MAGRFEGKVALITRGHIHIGAATAKGFALEGAKVVVVGTDESRLHGIVEEIQKNGGEASVFQTDIRTQEGAEAMIAHTVNTFGRLDILHNNNSILHVGRVADLAVNVWDDIIETTLKTTFLGTKYALPVMASQGGGSIINTASVFGLRGGYGSAAYHAAQGALINFTRAMAVESGRDNIRVNCICPGIIDTPALRTQVEQPRAVFPSFSLMQQAIPIRRLGTAEEVANVVLFLASEEASFITGAAYIIDGGLSASALPGDPTTDAPPPKKTS